MQQPSSQYYHATYGGFLDLRWKKGWPRLRATYWERPKFVSQGFMDQESAASVLLGGAVLETRPYSVRWYMGVGGVRGYLFAIEEARMEEDIITRYAIHGLVNQLIGSVHLGPFEAGVTHEFLVGLISQSEAAAYVAWPFQSTMMHLGWTF